MNAKRRKRLKDVYNHLSIAADTLEDVVGEERDCLDNTPENLQGSDAYAEREDLIDDMQDALDEIKLVMNSVSDLL